MRAPYHSNNQRLARVVSLCRTAKPARGQPDFHYCKLEGAHWGPHVCEFCGWAWSRPARPDAPKSLQDGP